MNKLLTPVLSVIVMGLAVAVLFSYTRQSALEQENASLRQQLEALTAAQPVSATAVAPDSIATRETTDSEVVRLRGEVTALRNEKQQLEKLRVENQNLRTANEAARSESKPNVSDIQIPKTHPREGWAFTGFTDPESALQSLLWAGANNNPAALLASLSPEQLNRMKTEDNQDRTDEEVAQRLAQQIAKIKGFQVLESRATSENETVLTLYIDGLEGSEKTPRMRMHKINNEWRLAGPYNPDAQKQ